MNENRRISVILAVAIILGVSLFFYAILPIKKAKCSGSAGDLEYPRHIILIIGDGMGINQQLAADRVFSPYQQNNRGLIMRTFPVQTRISTKSLSGITDTQAAFTALLTGHKTKNGMFARDKEGKPLTTIFQAAAQRGLSTGLVSSACLDGQSLALAGSYGGYNLIQKAVPVLLMNKAQVLILACADGSLTNQVSMLAANAGYTVKGPEDNWLGDLGLASAIQVPFLGWVKRTGTYYDLDQPEPQQHMLARSTRTALNLMDRNPNGFFLLVHGAQIDMAAHRNDLAAQLRETVALDEAVQEAYAYYLKHPDDTLVIVTGDHETGGMMLQPGYKQKFASNKAWLNTSREFLLKEYKREYLEKGTILADYLRKHGIKLEPYEAQMLQASISKNDWTRLDKQLTAVITSRFGVCYKTTKHTSGSVPLNAVGKGADSLAKCRSNNEVGQALLGIINGNCKQSQG